MIRQSSSRNQRPKGVRVKHILQICMLLAVCCWLIYQVKHSYDKRKHFEENGSEVSEKFPKFDDVVKLGRKDLHPRDEELSTNHEKIDDEEVEDEETLGKADETLEETREELEMKRKEEGSADIEALLDGTSRREEEAGERVGDDIIDEQDLDKVEKEGDGDEEEVVDGDKDIEKDEENETEEKDVDEDNEHERTNDGSSDDQDHDSSGDRHEAREEHYKADDASSAVEHVGQNILSENPERKNVNTDLDAQEHDDTSNEADVAKEQHLNDTNVLKTSNEATPPRLEDVLVKKDTNEASGGTVNSTPLNEGRVQGLTPEQNSMIKGLRDDKSSGTINGTENSPTITSNTNVEQDENSNSTNVQDFSTSELVVGSNVTSGTITNRTKSFSEDGYEEDVIRDRKDIEDDSILSSLNNDETLRDPLISEEEDKEMASLLDLDTLPESRTKGTDSDDAATE